MKRQDAIFESILERDMDFLLIEELTVNSDFVKEIFKNNIPNIDSCCNLIATHSVFDETGETDIYVEFAINATNFVVLIENKIDAIFQEKQPERYTLRKSRAIEHDNTVQIYTCLIASEKYIARSNESKKFDFYITYETIRNYFDSNTDSRSRFKAMVTDAAIERVRRGYTKKKDFVVSAFWHKYWEFLRDNYPEIIMKEPIDIPPGSDWPILYLQWLPEGWKIIHKMAQGFIDLQTNINDENLLEQVISGKPEFSLKKTGKSLSKLRSTFTKRGANFHY